MTAVMIADRSAVLVGEAHHRFFNSLQIIVSATNGILRSGGCNHEARERLEALQERIGSLAEINRCLSGPFGPESLSWQSLDRLCTCLAASFDRPNAAVWITVSGEMVEPDMRRPLLLLVSELMTNALKHSKSNEELLVGIGLTVTAEQHLLIVRSNTAGRNGVRPRIATEIAEAAGGTLLASAENGEFTTAVALPKSGQFN